MHQHPRSIALVSALLTAATLVLSGCITPVDQKAPPDAPLALHAPARHLRGLKTNDVCRPADVTVKQMPLDTGSVRRLVAEANPAVVSIFTKTSVPYKGRLLGLVRVSLPGQALGSGFFIHPDGYLLTNNHVLQNAESIRVLTVDGRELAVDVIARDPIYDLALLKVFGDQDPFPALPMGDSRKIEVGDFVIAIGNPLGLGHTVTQGIISQTNRKLAQFAPQADRYVKYLQTDTAINPGSSGGPLISSAGAWIGVNTAGVVSAQNIGFAVPSNQVREFLQNVLAGRGVQVKDKL